MTTLRPVGCLALVGALLACSATSAYAKDGLFGTPTDFPAGKFPGSVAVADFNGDRDPDLAVTDSSSDSVSILLGGPGGSFGAPTQFVVGDVPYGIAAGDFNQDGDPDLVVTNTRGDDARVLVGAAGGSFRTATHIAGAGNEVAVGDFNRDGDPDLAIIANGNRVSVLVGGARASFTLATTLTRIDSLTAIAVGDFNLDGDLDLATAGAASETVMAWRGGPGASFTLAETRSTFGRARDIVVADLNADSDPDVAVALMNEDGDYRASRPYLLGGADLSFRGADTAALPYDVNYVAAGDFNADSDPDLVYLRPYPVNVSVLLGDAGAAFRKPLQIDIAQDLASDVAVGDFNADGDPDLVIVGLSATVLMGSRPATATVAGQVLTYQASAEQANRVSVTRIETPGGARYRISDPGARRITARTGCSAETATRVTCQAAGVSSIRVLLGNRNDAATTVPVDLPAILDGGSGDDTLLSGSRNDDLNGGTGRDHFVAGAGNDRIGARDGAADLSFECGSGSDAVSADPNDPITARSNGCELVAKG